MPAERTETGTGSRPDTKLLSPLPPAEVYEPGVNLTFQGEMAARVYAVVEGVVKPVHVLPDGSERIVGDTTIDWYYDRHCERMS